MKTIMIFTGFYIPHLGGVENYTYNLSKQLITKGYKVIIITSNDSNYKDHEIIENIEIFRLPVFKIFSSRYPIFKIFNKSYKDNMKKIKNENVDFIIANTRFYLTSLVGNNIARKKNVEIYHIEHGSAYLTVNNKILDFFGKFYEHFITFLVKRKSNGFFAVSKAAGEWLKNFNIDCKGYWYNSINENDIPKLKEKSTDKIIFSFAGRMIEQKGVLNIINAFNKLTKKYDNIELHMLGDGALFEKLKKDNIDSKKVIFYGYQPKEKVFEVLNKSHVHLIPSTHPEGFPTSALEAGAMKNVLIVTANGGLKEIVDHETNGIIVDETCQSLYEAMELVIIKSDLIKKYGNKMYKKVLNNFTWKKTSNKIIDFLEKGETND